MLLNDTTRNDKMNGVHTRDLQNAVVRHHKNNPHVSMEYSFKYIMSISSTYRALPIEYIEKARRYLALPTVGIKPKGVTSEYNPSLFLVTPDEITPIGWRHITSDNSADTLEEPTEVPNGHIPLNDQQTVDYLVGLTNDLASQVVHRGSSKGYIFNCALGKLSKLKTVCIVDVIKARNELGLSTQLIESVAQCKNTTHQKKPIKPGTTVVHAERVVVDNKKMIKILEFENVQLLSNFPNKYTANTPFYCWFRSGIELKYYDAPHTIHQNVLPGDILSLKEFGKMIKTMKEAGVRLSKINKTAKLEKEHSGKFTVSI